MKELSLNILDLVQNSITAKATLVTIIVIESIKKDILSIEIVDNGCGMDTELLSRVTDPFTTRTTRKVGMGIPLFKLAAQSANGHFTITSAVGEGTRVYADFRYSHLDRPPLGDIVETIITLIRFNLQLDFEFIHKTDDNEIVLSTREMKNELGDTPLDTPEVVEWMREFLNQQKFYLINI